MVSVDAFSVDAAHNGPPASGHGGISAGLLSAFVAERANGVVVRLQSPVPLATAMTAVAGDDGSVTAYAGDTAIAVARPLPEPLVVEAFPVLSTSDVEAAAAAWWRDRDEFNPFPTCFGCGTARADGWRLSPGPVPDAGLNAAAWTARFDAAVPVWAPWAVLDCTQVGPVIEVSTPPAGLLTGEIALRSVQPVVDGAAYVAMSRRTGVSGKKVFTESVLLDAGNEPVAYARATWFVLPSY